MKLILPPSGTQEKLAHPEGGLIVAKEVVTGRDELLLLVRCGGDVLDKPGRCAALHGKSG